MRIKNFSLIFLLICSHFLMCLSFDVIVIGAGASGIAAASELSHNGHNVKILEARNRIGGRIYTDFESFGYPIDLGAILITQQYDNPIRNNAIVFNIKQVPMNFSDTSIYMEKNKIVKDGLGRFGLIKYNFIEFCKKNYILYKNKSVQFVLDEFKRKFYLTLIDKMLVTLVGSSMNFGLSRPLYDMKNFLFKGAVSFVGDAKMTPEGYIKTLEPEAKNLNIKFNTVIRSISQEEVSNKITLTDEKGIKYISDYVVLTVPLGYLKKNLIKFSPDLLIRKKEAIEKLGFFKMNKIFVEFEEQFWPDLDFIIFLVPPFIFDFAANMNKVYKNQNRNLLIFFIYEDMFNLIKNKKDSEIQEMLLQTLRSTFPQYETKMKIKKYLKTNWDDDPYTYGAFTEVAGHEYLRRRFEEPEGRLIFAGEHTSPKFNAFVYGAYLSGIRAAKQIINQSTSKK
jgi:monoamine oxidase